MAANTNSSIIQPDQTCQRFTLAEILSATNNFDETLVIGRGGFGNVYKCTHRIGLVDQVALKRLQTTSDQGAPEFEAEIEILSKLRHANLVSLIGYCSEGNEMVLAYEFMPNGNLQDHLRKIGTNLSWLQRLKICIGAARGLDYLHTGTSTQHGVIHRDVKTSNILLDANFAAKISDFGLARVNPINQTQTFVSTAVKGTHGYMDPTYYLSGQLTRKSYVYAFGVVLFEVLSGRQAVDRSNVEEPLSLVMWVQDQIKDGKLNQIVDPRLIGQISKKSLKEFASIAAQCFHNQPKQRPAMAEIVVKLDSILLQERKTTHSVGDEVNFIDRLRNYFISKAELTTPAPGGSRYEIRPQNVQKSDNVEAGDSEDESLIVEAGDSEDGSLIVEAGDSEDGSLIVEVDDSLDENGSGDYDREDGIELLPTIEGLQIFGEAFPGNEIQASGYSINGTTNCWFKWVRHLQDGSVDYIEDANNPNYTVTADDVDNYLAVEAQPLDGRQQKGELVTCFANDKKKITCHPDMIREIEMTLSVGHVSFYVFFWHVYLNTWEPAILEIKKNGYIITLKGLYNNNSVVVDDKYTPTTTIILSRKTPSEFSILGHGGIETYLSTELHTTTNLSCLRDTIVLTMRLFVKRAVDNNLGKKKNGFLFFK